MQRFFFKLYGKFVRVFISLKMKYHQETAISFWKRFCLRKAKAQIVFFMWICMNLNNFFIKYKIKKPPTNITKTAFPTAELQRNKKKMTKQVGYSYPELSATLFLEFRHRHSDTRGRQLPTSTPRHLF